MRAIDLYSGVGGWTLGFRLAGVEVVGAYEWWPEANRTYEANFGERPHQADIRRLPLESFPSDVDVVVGSPPCTQFSFANRGGNGDIADGLRDVARFLEVVEHIRPRSWVMENVPRVATILERELGPGGGLRRFRGLVPVITVVDMSEFGLPQRRKRMLAGDFPIDLLLAYRGREPAPTLGRVLDDLSSDPAVDPVFGLTLERSHLRDHLEEIALDDEEARLNRAMKQQHPFYNVMNFPDPRDRTARTVTALCTRVSRESIVVRGRDDALRRLTVRERASLQGFPLTFQFCGRSYGDKLKLVGNAVPPVLTCYIAQSLLGVAPALAQTPRQVWYRHRLPEVPPAEIAPGTPRHHFASDRRFRAVIPNLRFGSGVRFELANSLATGDPSWSVDFYFGTSRDIRTIGLTEGLYDRALAAPASRIFEARVRATVESLASAIGTTTATGLQGAWTRTAAGLHPFELVDRLDAAAREVRDALPSGRGEDVEAFVLGEAEQAAQGPLGGSQREKLRRNAGWILSGVILGAWFDARSGLRATEAAAATG